MSIDTQFDRDHLWHPYTSTLTPLPCYPVRRCYENKIELESGEILIDGMSSWWAAIHGYNHAQLNQAITDQLQAMSHVMFGGLTHEPAVNLGKRLLNLAPDNLSHVFFCDSGSVSVEVALKMALQYWHAKESPRAKFLTLRHGYHGDTFAAMSVTDPENSMHGIYKGFLPEHIFVPSPDCKFASDWQEEDFTTFKDAFLAHHDQLAAVILEPIVQGAGGMRFYHPRYLRAVREICDEYGVLLIADEIATGFGRTGKLFACQHADIQPDILCVGKALTGGYMSLAATLTTSQVANTVCSGSAQCFMHGPTFMANPLACAVANASLAIIEKGDWYNQVETIGKELAKHLIPLEQLTNVADVRCLGAIGVVETKRPVALEKIQAFFVKNGVWIRPFGKLIYVMPPFTTPSEDIYQLTKAIRQAVEIEEHFL